MIKNQPIIGVADVEKSSKWYQELLGCESAHGGPHFEQLTDEKGEIFLCLHKWEEHEHPTMSDSDMKAGHGLILYLVVEDLDKIWANAQKLNAKIEEEPQINPNSHKKQFSVSDLDGYYLMISL